MLKLYHVILWDIKMKELSLYQVDAFATSVFKGNPAAVCPLEYWLTDQQMQAIAEENNLSETAFIVSDGNQYQIRWFTPNTEVALCGHATLASAFVLFHLFNHPDSEIIFQSKSGELRVSKQNSQLQMDFPALPYKRITPSADFLRALNIVPKETYQSTFDLQCIFDDEADVQHAQLDLFAISQLEHRGVISSAPGKQSDIYSRCFYPACNVPEDPVTGSAHCVIAPHCSHRLNKNTLHAIQGLKRQGSLDCEVQGSRVLLTGTCHLYMQGTIFIPNE